MKAAVMYEQSGLPVYTEIPEPLPRDADEILVTVKAVAMKHVDKSRAKGTHYSSETSNEHPARQANPSGEDTSSNPVNSPGNKDSSIGSDPSGKGHFSGEARVIGGDGVCILPDGARVYAIGSSGMLAEKATVDKDRVVAIPDGLDDITAAALPNAVIGSAMGLKFKADIQPGDVVLVNGATGFTGRVAVQIAKYYGAGRVIATGRNPGSLKELLALGADEVLSVESTGFASSVAAIHAVTPIDIVIDYLWGRTAEQILGCVKGKGSFTNRIRYVSIGSMGGDLISLSAANLRSVDLQLSGSGLGAWSKAQVRQLFVAILPEMFRLAAEGRLSIKATGVRLEDIASIWDLDLANGARLVVTI